LSAVVGVLGVMGGRLIGELEGVISNGVCTWFVGSSSKPDWLEGGRLMLNRLELREFSDEGSGVRLSGVSPKLKVDVVDEFLVNRPSESRVGLVDGPLLVVRSASVTNA